MCIAIVGVKCSLEFTDQIGVFQGCNSFAHSIRFESRAHDGRKKQGGLLGSQLRRRGALDRGWASWREGKGSGGTEGRRHLRAAAGQPLAPYRIGPGKETPMTVVPACDWCIYYSPFQIRTVVGCDGSQCSYDRRAR